MEAEDNKFTEKRGGRSGWGEVEESVAKGGMDVVAHAASGTFKIPLLVRLFSPSSSTACLFIKQEHHLYTSTNVLMRTHTMRLMYFVFYLSFFLLLSE